MFKPRQADTNPLAEPAGFAPSETPFFRQVADALRDAGDSFAEHLSSKVSRQRTTARTDGIDAGRRP